MVETKLIHKNRDCEELQDRLRAALMRMSSLLLSDFQYITAITITILTRY